MITKTPNVARRSFIIGSAAVGAGFALGLKIPFGASVVRAQDGSPEITAWVVIRPDDTVVIRVARSEMGQGTLTGLAEMVAEELECDWSKVTTEYPTPGQSVARKRVWGDFSTGGSRGIRDSHQYVRQGGATARVMLVQAAADAWGVPASECSAANSVITHKPSGRTTTYGKVAEAAAKLTPPANVSLKDPKDWKLIGKSVKRLDTMDKLTGMQVYGADLKLPGMLNAAIKDCPVFGGKVKSFEAAKGKGMPGVRHVVPVGDSGVAVVADTWWQAKTALDALPIVWDEGPNAQVSSATIAEMLKAGLDADQAFVRNQNGDVKAAIAGAAKKVEAVYAYPFQNHATMEPMNATAKYTPDRCEVWVPTQNGEAAFAATTAASGLPAEKCEVYKINLGGGFGRRGAFHDYVPQAGPPPQRISRTRAQVLARREHQPERDLPRVLHGRAGACGRQGRARVRPRADEQASQAPRGAQRGGRPGGLGQAGAAGRLSWPRADDGVRQLRGGVRRDLRQRRRQGEGTSHRLRDGSRVCRQPGADRTTDRRVIRLRPVRAVPAGVHGQGRPHRADELPQLRLDADRPDAEGGIHHHAVGWLLGRRRRADDLRGGAGRAERVLRRHRQAHPHGPAEEPRHPDGVADGEASGRCDRARLDRGGRRVGGATGRRCGMLGVSSRLVPCRLACGPPQRARSSDDRQVRG